MGYCGRKDYKGNKPCPGCGLPGQESPRFKADTVCYECKENIRKGKNLKENPNDYMRFSLYAPGFTKCYLSYDVENETIEPAHSSGGYQNKRSEELSKAFKYLIGTMCLGDKKRASSSIREGGGRGYRPTPNYLPKEQGFALVAVFKALRCYSKQLYSDGYQAGNHLLNQLSKGEVTTKDYDARVKREFED